MLTISSTHAALSARALLLFFNRRKGVRWLAGGWTLMFHTYGRDVFRIEATYSHVAQRSQALSRAVRVAETKSALRWRTIGSSAAGRSLSDKVKPDDCRSSGLLTNREKGDNSQLAGEQVLTAAMAVQADRGGSGRRAKFFSLDIK